jgi:hypothetical protein
MIELEVKTRKITLSTECEHKAAMLLSKYHPELLLCGKKPEELLSLIIQESINFMYNNKLIPDFKETQLPLENND